MAEKPKKKKNYKWAKDDFYAPRDLCYLNKDEIRNPKPRFKQHRDITVTYQRYK